MASCTSAAVLAAASCAAALPAGVVRLHACFQMQAQFAVQATWQQHAAGAENVPLKHAAKANQCCAWACLPRDWGDRRPSRQ